MRRLGVVAVGVAAWFGFAAAPALATFHLNMVNEVMRASSSGDSGVQFVELLDHGGSEALFLHEQGVRFEVVPGVPAGVGFPCYAGVPITSPGGGDTITLIRGYEDEGKAERDIEVDWKSLAHLDGTLVCYAGPQQLPNILR